jgi:NADH-quinone oxidoreductase subunit M
MQFTEIQATWPLLESLQLVPLIFALIFWHFKGAISAGFALFTAVIEFALAIYLYLNFDTNLASMQFANQANLLGLPYHAAVDGISVLFVLLTALLGLLSVFFIIFRSFYHTNILAVIAFIQATLMSQFVTVDLLWFTVMSMLEIIATGYLLYRWATFVDGKPMIIRYSQFMSISILLLLIGTFMLGWNHAMVNGSWSFDLYDLSATTVAPAIATFIFFSLFYALGIRIPMFPLHGWLPMTMQYGNVTIAPILLLGLKVGFFGLLRFVFPVLPDAVKEWHSIAIIFAMIGIFYAALLAMRQNDLRRLMAYGVISHTGILTIGLFTLNRAGFEGSIMLAINFGLAISGLMFMTGLVFHRTKTAAMDHLGGLFQYMPLVGVAFLIAGLAIVAMPGTPGFDAVHLVLEASISEFGALTTTAAALGNVIAAGFLLYAFQQAFLAKPGFSTAAWDKSPSKITEKIMAISIIFVILGMGFFSSLWLDLFEHTLDGLTSLYSKDEGH